MKKKQMVNALKQLMDEKALMCKCYNDCRSCPCSLDGGFCEIKLAIKAMRRVIKQDNEGGDKNNIRVSK